MATTADMADLDRAELAACECSSGLSHPKDHGFLLDLEDDPAVLAQMLRRIVIWDAMEWPKGDDSPMGPFDYPMFIAEHAWRDQPAMYDLGVTLGDLWKNTRQSNLYGTTLRVVRAAAEEALK